MYIFVGSVEAEATAVRVAPPMISVAQRSGVVPAGAGAASSVGLPAMNVIARPELLRYVNPAATVVSATTV
jgi:hypothetical protein